MHPTNFVTQLYPVQLFSHRLGFALVWFPVSSPRRFWKSLATLTLVVTSFGGTVAADDPDLPEIARRLQEWRKSFATLDLTYHAWNREQLEARFEEAKTLATLDGRFYRKHRMIWTDSGRVLRENWRFEEGILVDRDNTGTNLIVNFKATTGRDKPKEYWAAVRATPVTVNTLSGPVPEPLSFLWDWTGWLGERCMDSSVATLTGYENREDTYCAVVDFIYPSPQGRPASRVTLWLDTERDFLPRWQDHDASGVAPDLDYPRNHTSFVVKEFQKLDNGRWFPMRGFRKLLGDDEPGNEWVVKEVRINQSYPKSTFDPPEQPKRIRNQSTRSGTQEQAVEPPAQRLGDTPAVDAAIPRSSWVMPAMIAATVPLLVGALWLRIRNA